MSKILMAFVAFLTLGSVASAAERGEAIFAGGCFWCMETAFKIPGVTSVVSGFSGGRVANPSYEQVSGGDTGHAESVHVVYDPTKITYAKLLQVYWHNVDPLNATGQFCDRGSQYRTAIFTYDQAQKDAAEASKKAIEAKLGKKIYTEITPASAFYPAEDYHQEFYKKNPEHYQRYREGCGRDRRLHEIWGDEAGHH